VTIGSRRFVPSNARKHSKNRHTRCPVLPYSSRRALGRPGARARSSGQCANSLRDDGGVNGQPSARIVYDADCGFCTRWARWIDDRPVAWQSLDVVAVGATEQQAATFVGWLVDGRIAALGAPAVAAALTARGGWTRPIGLMLDLPGARLVGAGLYRVVAAQRHRLPGGTPACRAD
jgi:predicted DCC family thiol-disulfide oxidoreductase YuxK